MRRDKRPDLGGLADSTPVHRRDVLNTYCPECRKTFQDADQVRLDETMTARHEACYTKNVVKIQFRRFRNT